MTTGAWIGLAIAAVCALANWWSRWRDHRPTELWSKPLTLVALIGVALAIDPAEPVVRWWFVAALVLSLAGDVFLLGDDRWFVPGLAAFLAGHLAYTVGFVVLGLVVADTWRWWPVAIAAVAVIALVLVIGRRIVAGATSRDRALRLPVMAYLAVISTMLLAAAGAGNAWAIAGATLFVVSDTVLGWRQFVTPRPWMAPAIMVTYHLAQTGLVLSLV
jgi:uncharacterized membrane protein YhhN